MKHLFTIHKSLALIAGLVAAACGADGQAGPESESVTEPITGGTLTGAAYSSVVYYNGHCTATKIGARRFLTAGHCLDGLIWAGNTNPTISMTSALDGVSNIVNVGLVKAYHHPSRVNLMIQNPAWQSHYDAAVLEVDNDTPMFTTSGINPTTIYNGDQGTLVGYGCDDRNATHNGRKQTATITALSLLDLMQAYPTQPVEYLADVNNHFVTFDNARGVALCPGDSGGPTFRNGNFVMGISSSRDGIPNTSRVMSHITRTESIRGWLTNPVENLFQVGSGGSLMNAWAGKCVSDNASSGILSVFCGAPSQTTDKQYWTLGTHPASGYFSIVNGSNGECLTRLNSGVDTRACTGNDAQAWRFSEVASYPPFSVAGQQSTFKYYRISNRTGNCLTTTTDAQAGVMDTQPCATTSSQEWVFTR